MSIQQTAAALQYAFDEIDRLRAALESILEEATAESTQTLSATAAIRMIEGFGDTARAALAKGA